MSESDQIARLMAMNAVFVGGYVVMVVANVAMVSYILWNWRDERA